jgi:YidC/Oxa1 family membrane protein insertase
MPANPTEQETQQLQMQRTMIYISPLMIGFFALQVPAGLGLYWFIGNCVGIIQQSLVVGWGGLFGRGPALPDVKLPKSPPSRPALDAKELPKRLPEGGGKNSNKRKRQRPSYGQSTDK